MTTPHTTIKPISDYAAILVEMEHWKGKFYDLQAQISEIRQTGTDTIIIKEGGTARYIRLADIIMMQADSNYTTIHLAYVMSNGGVLSGCAAVLLFKNKLGVHWNVVPGAT